MSAVTETISLVSQGTAIYDIIINADVNTQASARQALINCADAAVNDPQMIETHSLSASTRD